MSGFNKYGSIKNGLISARFYIEGDQTDYGACYELFNNAPIGDKFDLPMEAALVDNAFAVTQNGRIIGYLPITWKAFVSEVASRGPIKGSGALAWMKDKQHFRVRFDIDEF